MHLTVTGEAGLILSRGAVRDAYCVKAIYCVCMQYFPLQRLETQFLADKEMRTAIDETCRKTKDISLMDKENCGIGSLL